MQKTGDAKKPSLGKAIIKPWNPAKAHRYIVLVFFVISWVLYGNTLWNKYSIDDNFVTGPENQLVRQGIKAIPAIFTTPYYLQTGNLGSSSADYRPVVKLTFAIEYQLTGKDRPMLSHAINVLLYFFLASLLFLILRRILKEVNILFPFLITLVFMVHPVHTEVVASLKNRDEMLAFICGLGTLHFLLNWTEKKRIRDLLLACLVFIIGYLSKSSILPFLAIYPLVLWFFTGMKPRKFLWVFLVLLAVTLMAHFIPRLFLIHVDRVRSFIENPLYFEKNFWIRTGTGMTTLLFYLLILFYPNPLIFYYGYDMIPVTGWGNLWVILSFLIHAILLLIALVLFRKKHILSFAILYYLVAISMYSNIVSPAVGIVAERFVFNASVGFAIAVVWLIFRIFRTDPRSLTIELNERIKILGIVFAIVVPFAMLTINRNKAWHDLFRLYKTDIVHMKRSVKGNLQYAGYLTNRVFRDPNFQQYGNVPALLSQTIINHYNVALKLYPDDYKSLNELGSVYVSFAGKPDSAILAFKKAIRLDPDQQSAWVNLGFAYRKKQEFDSALYCYNKILSINPGEIKAHFAIADLYFERGDLQQAVRINQEVMEKFPGSELPYINIGRYLMMAGDTAASIQYF